LLPDTPYATNRTPERALNRRLL